MRAFQNTSIKRKLTLIIMLTSTVALLLACGAFVAYEMITFRRGMVRDLFTLAEIIGYNSTAALTFDDVRSAEETLAALSAEPHVVSACIYTKDGNVFARYLRGGVKGDFPPEPAEDSHRFEDDDLVLFRSIVLDGERIGTVYVQSDLQEMRARLRRYAGIVVLVLLVSSLSAFGLSSKLRRVISEPILHLVQTARVVSDKKDYSVRAAKRGQDEVGLLIDAFNEMLAQIQERDGVLEKRAQELQKELTERKRAEEALRQAEARYRSLFEGVPVGIYRTTVTGEILDANPALVQMLHYPDQASLMAVNVVDTLVDTEDRQQWHALMESEGIVHNFEMQVRQHNGTIIWVRDTGQTVRDADGQVLYYEGAMEDITERKRAEEALAQRAEELARSNAELEQFSYVASHDLQEPLRKIQAFGDRLKTKYGDALSGQGGDYLERMQNAAARMQILINDLLTFSRVTTKAQPFVPVDLAKVTREVVSDLEVRIEETGGRVEVDDLPTIDADPLQMRQLLQNLIGNALKFHREEAPVVKIHSQLLKDEEPRSEGSASDDGLCQITVQDNGIGFDEKYTDRIFGIFQRLHGRSTYEGTGVGLAICRKIVERHGGSITAESTPGQGTTFIVTLPVQHPKGEEAP